MPEICSLVYIYGVQKTVSALLALIPLATLSANPITFNNLPLGSEDKPLILRTYILDPGLDSAYFPHHGTVAKSPSQLLYDSLGCSACHSINSALGHGSTLAVLFGSERLVEGSKQPVKVDKAYLLESIKAPNAKIAKGFPPNYMPPYALKDLEYESLLLFI